MPIENSLRKSDDRNPRPRTRRPDRPESSDRAPKADRPDRPESSDRAPRAARPDRPESSDRAPRTERPDRPESSDRAPKTDRPAAPESSDRPEPADTYEPSHGATLDTYFDVYDNPGGGDTDGRVSSDDLAEVASGDYDREAAEDRLRDQGVDADEIDATLDRIEATARYYGDHEDAFADVDGINEGGDTDDRVTRDDLTTALAEERDELAGDVNLNDDEALAALEENFANFDNPNGPSLGDGTDGNVSRDDLEAIAGGDYNREAARARLRDQGVSEEDLDVALARNEATARHLLGNEDFYGAIDGANDGGHVDGNISVGDIDKLAVERHETPDPLTASEEEIAEAEEIFGTWTSPADVTRELEERPDLAEYSQAELLALAWAQEADPAVARQVQDHVIDAVEAADSLGDLPEGIGFQQLLQPVVEADPEENEAAANAQEHLRGLVDHNLETALDARLRDRSGDSEADLALQRWGHDAEALAARNPALAGMIADRAEVELNESGGQLTDVRRDDDGIVRQAVQAGTGFTRGVFGGVAEGIRAFGRGYGWVVSAPGRALGEVADWGLTSYGQVAGAALDVAGADGLADDVRGAARRVGNGVNGASDWGVEQNRNFFNGFFGAPADLVEGIGHLNTNPIGVARGAWEVHRNPALLLEPYRERRNEQGWAGVAGGLTFDVLATVATAGGSSAVTTASNVERAVLAAGVFLPTDPAGAASFSAANAEGYIELGER